MGGGRRGTKRMMHTQYFNIVHFSQFYLSSLSPSLSFSRSISHKLKRINN